MRNKPNSLSEWVSDRPWHSHTALSKRDCLWRLQTELTVFLRNTRAEQTRSTVRLLTALRSVFSQPCKGSGVRSASPQHTNRNVPVWRTDWTVTVSLSVCQSCETDCNGPVMEGPRQGCYVSSILFVRKINKARAIRAYCITGSLLPFTHFVKCLLAWCRPATEHSDRVLWPRPSNWFHSPPGKGRNIMWEYWSGVLPAQWSVIR